jgi:hypothetical protein
MNEWFVVNLVSVGHAVELYLRQFMTSVVVVVVAVVVVVVVVVESSLVRHPTLLHFGTVAAATEATEADPTTTSSTSFCRSQTQSIASIHMSTSVTVAAFRVTNTRF